MASKIMLEEGPVAAPPSPPLNGHAQRSAITRHKLIAATVDCLNDGGYAAATTVAVAARAGVSRGAMLHQFRTRADLIIATAEHILRDQDRQRRLMLAQVPRGRERFYALTDAVWQTMRQPASMAFLEIMLGSRSDPELKARFPAVMRDFNDRLLSCPIEVAKDIGYQDAALLGAMTRLHLAAMRGLAIDRLFHAGDDDEGGFELLLWYKRLVMERLDDPGFVRAVADMPRPLAEGTGASARSREIASALID